MLPVVSGVPQESLKDQFLGLCFLSVIWMLLQLPLRGVKLMTLLCTYSYQDSQITLSCKILIRYRLTCCKYIHFNKTKCRTMLVSWKHTQSCPHFAVFAKDDTNFNHAHGLMHWPSHQLPDILEQSAEKTHCQGDRLWQIIPGIIWE